MTHRTAGLRLLLFTVYVVLYGGFVLIAAFEPETMERTPLAGVNVAIWYGFGLIVAALVLALIYGWACQRASGEADGVRNRVDTAGDQP